MKHEGISNAPILKVCGVSKKFSRNFKKSLLYGLKDIFSELTISRPALNDLRDGEFWAVDAVGFEVGKGEAVALVGANGSGKSTLLRMISGLIKVDAGEINVCGRVVPLIALGAGFNQILSGRENIYVNLAILGLNKAEIDDAFEDVIEFADIGDALDAPVQTYSSGMTARLGFACAVHARADLLLIDEVLSVGDMRFRSKCYRKLAELRKAGTAFILVSHNTNAILSMCDRAIYLSKGKAVHSGEPYEVMSRFEEDMSSIPDGVSSPGIREDVKNYNIFIKEILLRTNGNNIADHLITGLNAKILVHVKCEKPEDKVILSAIIRELSGECETVLFLSSDNECFYFDLSEGEHELIMEMPVCGLSPGLYSAKIYVHKPPFYIFDAIESFVFRVKANDNWKQGLFYQSVKWDLC